MQKIGLKNLRVSCIIGTLPYEREIEQEIYVNLSITGDWSQAVSQDDLSLTLDYVQLAQEVTQVLKQGKFQLLETAAKSVSDHCLNSSRVSELTVSLHKPAVMPGVDEAFFELTQKKN